MTRRVKAEEDDDDYVQSPSSIQSGSSGSTCSSMWTKQKQLYKDQTVTIENGQAAVVVDPMPNERGDILVQCMKWVPLEKIETKVSHPRETITRKSRRKKVRPGYLAEDKSFFVLPAGRYHSNKLLQKQWAWESQNKGAGSKVTHAFLHDQVRGLFYNVPCKNSKLWEKMNLNHVDGSAFYKNDMNDSEVGEYKTPCFKRPIKTKSSLSIIDVDNIHVNDPSPLLRRQTSSECSMESSSFDSSDDEASLPHHLLIRYRKRARLNDTKNEGVERVVKYEKKTLYSSPMLMHHKTSGFDGSQLSLKSPSRNHLGKDRKTLWEILSVPKDSAIPMIKSILPPALKHSASQMGEFFLFCQERQNIWMKKKQGQPRPWTADTILDAKFFTNIYRELDAGTVYFRRHVIKVKSMLQRDSALEERERDFRHDYCREVLWASLIYRCIGRIETFEEIGEIPLHEAWEPFREALKDLHERNQIIFSPAYQSMGIRRYLDTMNHLVLGGGLRDLSKQVYLAAESGDIKGCTDAIQQLFNIGCFYAWQVTCDLMESGVIRDCKASTFDWVRLGPGAMQGLKQIFGEHKSSANVSLCQFLRDHQTEIYDALGIHFVHFDGKGMSLKVLEHALCEFHKYKSCEANEPTFKIMRLYKLKDNNSRKMPMDPDTCAGCDTNLTGNVLLCDTCWRYFCPKCSQRTAKKENSWLCLDCRECEMGIFCSAG